MTVTCSVVFYFSRLKKFSGSCCYWKLARVVHGCTRGVCERRPGEEGWIMNDQYRVRSLLSWQPPALPTLHPLFSSALPFLFFFSPAPSPFLSGLVPGLLCFLFFSTPPVSIYFTPASVYSQPTFFFSISHLSSIFPFFAHPPIRIVFSFCPVREFDPYTLCRPFSPPSYRVGPTYWMQLLRTVRFVAMVTI